MPKKKPRPSAAISEFLFPYPRQKACRSRELYRERTGEEIAEDETRNALSRIMRFQYLNVISPFRPSA